MNRQAQVTGGLGLIGSILAAVLYLEGGYTNDPTDPGGETNYGITEQTARSHGYTGRMEDLTRGKAEEIYTQSYVLKPGYHLVLEHSPAVAHKLIDAGVNTGSRRASLWFQKALNSLSRGGLDYPMIEEDGIIGPSTIAAYVGLTRKRGPIAACELVIKLVDAQQAVHYMSLPSLSQFTIGWVSHRIGNVPLSQCANYDISH